MNERHRRSVEMSFALLSKQCDNVWNIKSEDGVHSYQISVLSETCADVACQLRCIDCGVCCHTYHCTCPDFLLKNISCKHIHLLRRQQQRVNSSDTSKQDEDEKEDQHVTDDNIKDSQVYLNNEITSSFSTLVSEKKEN